MPTFRYSIAYLFSLFTLLLADHYLLAVIGAGSFASVFDGR